MKQVVINIYDNGKIEVVNKENKTEEKEKPTIKTYQDLVNNKREIKGFINTVSGKVVPCNARVGGEYTTSIATSEKVAKSMIAMAAISQIMPYYGGEITEEEWENTSINKFTIERDCTYIDCIHTDLNKTIYHFLAFHTLEQRDEFLKYNEQLVKDYLMIN